jgi:nucleoside-diphosphate-sugar epimerase
MGVPRTVLVIGGTRNLGYDLVLALRAAGSRPTVLNRGRTPDELPPDVERLRADRTDGRAFAAALGGRTFDAVVDTTLYDGAAAAAVVSELAARTGRYVWLSTGQVYLVREGLARPFREDDYPGPVMREPPSDGVDWADWRYGIDKRAAEDVLAQAWQARRFPVTTLRIPMVNSRRDHFDRLLGYVGRLRDGGPILVPDVPDHALRLVDGDDVVGAILMMLETGRGIGGAWNLAQDETVSLDGFLALAASALHVQARIVRVPRRRLEDAALLPGCSPFSDRWMSELDNRRSRSELGVRYTPLEQSLDRLVRWHVDHPERVASSYGRRGAELALAAALC